MDTTNFVQSVGQIIAQQRKRAGLTQIQVAEKLGVEKETVSRLETGANPPTLKRLEQLAEILGCPVRCFFWRTEGNDPAQAETIADMIRSLPPERRARVVRFVEDVVRVLQP